MGDSSAVIISVAPIIDKFKLFRGFSDLDGMIVHPKKNITLYVRVT